MTKLNDEKSNLLNPNIKGFVDYCDYQRVSGWLANLSELDGHLSFKILIDGIEIYSGIADKYRKDMAENPKFNGTNHAYNFKIPNCYMDGKKHEIKVIELNTGYQLQNSPINIIFPNKNKTVVYIIAPNASGKTTSAIKIAKEFGAELFHADKVYDILKEKYQVPVESSRLTVYELWDDPKNFGINSWGKHKNISEAKREIYKQILSDIKSDFIVIEGFTLSFSEERKMVEDAIGKHRAIIIRIVMPFENWSNFYEKKFGISLKESADFDRLTMCFSEMDNDEIYIVDDPNKINSELFKKFNIREEVQINKILISENFSFSNNINFITKDKYEFNALRTMSNVPIEKNQKYWADYDLRWLYHEKAIQILKKYGVKSADKVLELGTMGVCLVDGSHTMDYNVNLEHLVAHPKYLCDARSIPWPIDSNSYEWFIALRVFHHLWPVQRECFEEALRVSKNIILVVPHILPVNHNLGHAAAITPSDFRAWNHDIAPQECVPVGEFGFLYVWLNK
jgi:hypothetical protein